MEGDALSGYRIACSFGFLPTPSHGGRHCTRWMGGTILSFLPTPSHGGRLSRQGGFVPLLYFYPRPHMEGDPVKVVYELETPVDFYPRPHMEGDRCKLLRIHRCKYISTHALTWRATSLWRVISPAARDISTHALTWRATGWSFARMQRIF